MSPPTTLVEGRGLSRFYGVVLGLNNVDFRIRSGITGVVGPNGAGKTTLFRLLTGQIKPSAGELRVLGGLPWSDPAVRAQLAYCPEDETVPAGVNPMTWLTGLGQMSGLSGSEAKRRARAMLERVRLPEQHWRKAVSAYSKGMKQRVKLAQCLMHEPRLIILDEPMNGLDPMGREEFGRVLRDLSAEGTSVVISSHILQDLEALCRDFIVLRWGRIPTAGNALANAHRDEPTTGEDAPETVAGTAAAVARAWPRETTLRCSDPEKLAGHLLSAGLLQGCDLDVDAGTVKARWRDPAAFYANFAEHLLASGVVIHEVHAPGSTLESAFEPPPLPTV